MNIKDITDDVSYELFQTLLKSGGVIHGGCLRDLIAGKEYNDIDMYFSRLSPEFPKVKYADDRIDILLDWIASLIKQKDNWNNIEHAWADKPLDHYGGDFDSCYMVITKPNFKTAINILFHNDDLDIDAFLDFDINSLYLLPDGTICSYLGADAVESIVKNIRNNKCKLLRSDVSDDRIDHILEKGFKCDLLVFR